MLSSLASLRAGSAGAVGRAGGAGTALQLQGACAAVLSTQAHPHSTKVITAALACLGESIALIPGAALAHASCRRPPHTLPPPCLPKLMCSPPRATAKSPRLSRTLVRQNGPLHLTCFLEGVAYALASCGATAGRLNLSSPSRPHPPPLQAKSNSF